LIFLEINNSLDFIDRWTVFAGLWFEIIEPALTEEDKAKYASTLPETNRNGAPE
jgi:hypothetical protein